METWYQGKIDLTRYPITDLSDPQTVKFINESSRQLERVGAAELPEFVTPEGVKILAEESSRLESKAHWNALVGNAYLDEPDSSLPPDHATRLTEKTSLAALGYDQFPADSFLKKIFEWDALMQFVAAILKLPKIYRYADPMGALNLSVMKDGDYLRWHFDQTDFVTSLSIRNAEKGGEFEYVPKIRSRENQNYDRVKATLNGNREGVVHIPNRPGTLLLFQGRYSIHRVTPIQGKTNRLMGLFGYAAEPGVISSEYLRKIRYGRTTPLK